MAKLEVNFIVKRSIFYKNIFCFCDYDHRFMRYKILKLKKKNFPMLILDITFKVFFEKKKIVGFFMESNE